MNNSMAKIKKIESYQVDCDNPKCDAVIKTEKKSGKVQCFRCGERTDLDG